MAVFYDKNYIRVIDQAVAPELCAKVIELFEEDHQRHHHDGDRYIELDIFANRTAQHKWLPRNAKLEQWQPLANSLVDTVNQLVSDYRQHWDPLSMMPGAYAMEGMRVKAYRANTHEFRMHVDQGNRDSACRFLACLLYLNDSEAGTEFPQENFTVEALEGRIVLFPPNWQYPHRGLMPTEKTKYILSTYLHYKD